MAYKPVKRRPTLRTTYFLILSVTNMSTARLSHIELFITFKHEIVQILCLSNLRNAGHSQFTLLSFPHREIPPFPKVGA